MSSNHITTADKITICNAFKIKIQPKEVKGSYCNIIINNNGKEKKGENLYNVRDKQQFKTLWNNIQALYLQYFNHIITTIPIAIIEEKIAEYCK